LSLIIQMAKQTKNNDIENDKEALDFLK